MITLLRVRIKFFISTSSIKSLTILRSFSRNLKIIYFGNDLFSLSSIKMLNESFKKKKLKELQVVTSFRANKNPIKKYAQDENLKLIAWEDFKGLPHQENEYDVGLVVSFGHLIPEVIINSFRFGMLNIHASLLPKYRGASPIIYALRNGDTSTGVSLMRIEPKHFDIGEVLLQKEVQIEARTMMPQLHDKLAIEGAKLLSEYLSNGDKCSCKIQDNSLASYAPKIDIEFSKVRWLKMTAVDVFNLYRSLYTFKHPSTTFQGDPVKLIEINYDSNQIPNLFLKPGQVSFCKFKNALLVQCADYNTIEILKLSIAKKKVMSARDFDNGFLKKCLEAERNFL